MINRELIRLKLVQIAYSFYQSGSKNPAAAEKELLLSLSRAYDLYNTMLYFDASPVFVMPYDSTPP